METPLIARYDMRSKNHEDEKHAKNYHLGFQRKIFKCGPQYLSEALEGSVDHAPGHRISHDEVVWLSVARHHPQLDALGHLELLRLGEKGPEWLSPYRGALPEEFPDEGTLILLYAVRTAWQATVNRWRRTGW